MRTALSVKAEYRKKENQHYRGLVYQPMDHVLKNFEPAASASLAIGLASKPTE